MSRSVRRVYPSNYGCNVFHVFVFVHTLNEPLRYTACSGRQRPRQGSSQNRSVNEESAVESRRLPCPETRLRFQQSPGLFSAEPKLFQRSPGCQRPRQGKSLREFERGVGRGVPQAPLCRDPAGGFSGALLSVSVSKSVEVHKPLLWVSAQFSLYKPCSRGALWENFLRPHRSESPSERIFPNYNSRSSSYQLKKVSREKKTPPG